MTDANNNGHSNDVGEDEDDRNGESASRQNLIELLNSQLQNSMKLEERHS